jgi:radical SAM protein with 4Fe4S-binding SPASM domain
MDILNKTIQLTLKNRKLYNVVLELNTICNWKCKHCYIPEHNDLGMDKDTIFNIFKQLRDNGVFEVTLTGGEIFLRPDIMEIIEKAREMYFKVTLFTNISLLNEEKIKKLSEYFISQISCTIFSLNPNIHDYITGINGSFDRAMENIKLIKSYKIPLQIKTILTNVNYSDTKEISEFCNENGFSYNIDHDIFSQIDGNSLPHELRMTKDQLNIELKYLDKLRGFKPREHKDEEFACYGIQNSLYIDCNGLVYPCNKYLKIVGDLNKENIYDIWNKSNELHRIQDMKWKDLHKCYKCNIDEYCMHCPGTAMLEDGDEYGASMLACEKADIRKQIYARKG